MLVSFQFLLPQMAGNKGGKNCLVATAATKLSFKLGLKG